MKMIALVTRNSLLSAAVLCLLLPAAAGIARADRVVNANEPIVISDDITDMTQPVVSASFASGGEDSGGNGNDDNRSGLGDDTNPGQGGGTDNAVNDGTDNPNNTDPNN
jgi:hypothetical protein